VRVFCGLLALAVLCAGCARSPEPLYTAAVDRPLEPGIRQAVLEQPMPESLIRTGTLAGRTLTVGSADEIVLGPREVVLTFDDGPRPGRTDAILDTLAAHGVHATFLVIGQAARQHPQMVQRVALAGHTIGTHTFSHPRLDQMSNAEAMGEIVAGEEAVAAALAPIGQAPSAFFRFPYLAQTGFLRASLGNAQVVVLDVDIDSQDYVRQTPAEVMARTLERLERRGNGVILFHDIHPRTVAMLPDFLTALRERGYRVVHLRTRQPAPDGPMILAQAGSTP
jgi:peptidoglycan/xylan/chitin deacetylase (PgdA/CDA1 family)